MVHQLIQTTLQKTVKKKELLKGIGGLRPALVLVCNMHQTVSERAVGGLSETTSAWLYLSNYPSADLRGFYIWKYN